MSDLPVSGSILLESNTSEELTISKNNSQTLSQISFGIGSTNINGEISFKTIDDGLPDNLVERMRVHTNGHVGIGTDAPEFPLHIPEQGLQVGTSSDPANSFYLVNEHDPDPNLNSRTFRLYHKGESNHLLTVASLGGRMGIGTKIPQNKLDVEGNVVIGSTFAGNETAPENGLLVEGNVGIGSENNSSKLVINGDINIIDENHGSFHYGNRGALGQAQSFNPADDKNGLWIEGRTNLNPSVSTGIFMNESTMCLWCPGESDGKFPILRIYGSLDERPRFEMHINGDISIEKNLTIRGMLTSLNVADDPNARVRAHDFWLGHPTRRGAPGRALVDYTNTLHLNYVDRNGPAWTYTKIGGIIQWDTPSEAVTNGQGIVADLAERILNSIQAVRFSSAIMKKDSKIDKKTDTFLGIIAEDVSGLVGTTDGKGINIMGLMGVLTTVVKEQQKEIIALKKAILGKNEKSEIA